jgi:hypothetical protein
MDTTPRLKSACSNPGRTWTEEEDGGQRGEELEEGKGEMWNSEMGTKKMDEWV